MDDFPCVACSLLLNLQERSVEHPPGEVSDAAEDGHGIGQDADGDENH